MQHRQAKQTQQKNSEQIKLDILSFSISDAWRKSRILRGVTHISKLLWRESSWGLMCVREEEEEVKRHAEEAELLKVCITTLNCVHKSPLFLFDPENFGKVRLALFWD